MKIAQRRLKSLRESCPKLLLLSYQLISSESTWDQHRIIVKFEKVITQIKSKI